MGDQIRSGNNTKRRVMYFSESSKRDIQISTEEEERQYRQAFVQYCAGCMERYGLEAGKLGIRRIGECQICGNDGFLVGSMGRDDDQIDGAMNELRAEYPVEGM